MNKAAHTLLGAAVAVGAPLLVLGFAGCDENKYDKMLEAGAPSASIAAIPLASSLPPSPLPPPPKKKEWKCSQSVNVDFQGDTALEAEVRLKLQKPKGDIKTAELANVKSINLTKYGPSTELNPCLFPKFTGLHDLFIGQGELDDLKPIADLSQLVSLRATENKVKDISMLKKLVHLDRLDLAKTQVTDISVIANMTDLTELELDGTPITDLSALAGLKKLEKVTVANTAIKDVSPLKNSKTTLKLLDISGTPTSDYSMLAGNPKLQVKM
jgi:internalin A